MESISIVIPVYNEEQILVSSIFRLHSELSKLKLKDFEIILSENGSSDHTGNLARNLAKQFSQVRVVTSNNPSFGKAFKIAANITRYSTVVLFNADWWDVRFLQQALKYINRYPIIVGSKELNTGDDERPWIRKTGTMALTIALKLLFGFKGSDSHGLKLFRKKELIEILDKCISHEIIESELLIRAQRKKLSIKELPVSIKEIRPPRVSFLKRCLRVLKELVILKINLG